MAFAVAGALLISQGGCLQVVEEIDGNASFNERRAPAGDSFVIEGVSTTIGFLSKIVRDEEFVAGNVDTSFIDRYLSNSDAGS